MPFFKTHEVPREFSKEFLKHTTKKLIAGDNREHFMLPIPLHTGEVVDFMVRYFKRSGESTIEDVKEYYPCIVIQDFQPVLNTSLLWGKDYIEGVKDLIKEKREIITLPLPLKYRFQVSVITGRLREIQSASDWFFRTFNFQRPGSFLFNPLATDEGLVGDVVTYKAKFLEVPRDDRKFEYSFDYTLDTFVHATSKKYAYNGTTGYTGGDFRDSLQTLNVTLNRRDFEAFKDLVVGGFIIGGDYTTQQEFERHVHNENTHLNLIFDGTAI